MTILMWIIFVILYLVCGILFLAIMASDDGRLTENDFFILAGLLFWPLISALCILSKFGEWVRDAAEWISRKIPRS